MKINIASVMDALRSLALANGALIPKGNIPLFNRIFLRMVRYFGRSYDLPMIAVYKLGTRNIMPDTDKFPTMLKKGKMALLPPSGANKHVVQQIFRKAQQGKGTME
jgi:hypothetical protein